MDVVNNEINIHNDHPVNHLSTKENQRLNNFDCAIHDPKNMIKGIDEYDQLVRANQVEIPQNITEITNKTKPWSNACNTLLKALADNDIKYAIALEQENVNPKVTQLINKTRHGLGLKEYTQDQFKETNSPILQELTIYSIKMLNLVDEQYKKTKERTDPHMMAFITRIRNFSDKIEQVPDIINIDLKEFKKEPININALTDEIVQDITREKANGKLNIVVNKPDKPTIINSDPGALKQIIENLVFNAIKYSAKNPNGNIYINITNDNIYVTDEGWGMTPETVAKVSQFKKGYRSEDVKDEINGTGHGLPFANKLNNKLGFGDIKVYSSGLTFGSTFSVNYAK